MKKCPFCAEEIQEEAVKCRYCGEYLNKAKKYKGCLIGCLTVSAAALLLIVTLSLLGSLAIKFAVRSVFPGTQDFSSCPPLPGSGLDVFFNDLLESLKRMLEGLSRHSLPRQI